MPRKFHTLLCRAAFIALGLTVCVTAAAASAKASTPPFGELDIAHPYCAGTMDLAISDEYFTEVSNPLPGVADFNALVKDYHSKEWQKFDLGVETFDRVHETSPLREAVAFLRVQSLWDRVQKAESPELNAAEKGMREALLLYPKSTLAPVVVSTAAAYWLKQGKPKKSLALYLAAKEKYPLHELACVFQMGTAESNYQVGDLTASRDHFKALLQKCHNPRLKLGAELRLADIQATQAGAKKGVGEAALEKLFRDQTIFMHRYYPNALYTLGEMKFAGKNYPTAKYYFQEFLKNERVDTACQAYALKRIADIGYQLNAKPEEVQGLYLTVYDKVPNNDVGRFSHARALLLGMGDVKNAERIRRIKIVDEDLEKISDEALRREIFLEKGLALLGVGDAAALDYLLRLNEKEPIQVGKGKLGPYIRHSIWAMLDDRAQGLAPLGSEAADFSDLVPFEKAYSLWIKGSPDEAATLKAFQKMMVARFEKEHATDPENGMELLDRWRDSAMWSEKSLDKAQRQKVGHTLLAPLLRAEPEAAKNLATEYVKFQPILKAIVGNEVPLLWMSMALKTNDTVGLKKIALADKSLRTITNAESDLPGDLRPLSKLATAEALMAMHDTAGAEKALAKVDGAGLKEKVLERQVRVFRSTKQYGKAFDAAKKLAVGAKPESALPYLTSLREIATEGKLWKQAEGLAKLAKEKGVQGKASAPFLFTSAKANFELSHCKDAIESYNGALALDAEAKEAPEARYRLGKCLIQQKDKPQAKKIWTELANSQDPFWSPLVKNELKLLSQ